MVSCLHFVPSDLEIDKGITVYRSFFVTNHPGLETFAQVKTKGVFKSFLLSMSAFFSFLLVYIFVNAVTLTARNRRPEITCLSPRGGDLFSAALTV